mmetsp:Transcript_72459/g.206302  ORF Transcript_72459/g.206302 Transcript_72459/m.206302 type:complete len:432 (-) Transcript_72459:113-1408(-)
MAMSRQVVDDLLETKVGTLLDPRFHMSEKGQRILGTLFAGVFAAKLLLRVFSSPAPSEDYVVDPNVGADYKVVSEKEPELEDMPQLNLEMRRTFDAGYTLPIAKRLEQLRAMRKMLVESEGRILAALKEDLNRPQFEAIFYDIKVPLLEIDQTIRSLRQWAAPEYKGFNMLTFPSTQWLQKQPYGCALVIGSWNYPFCLSLIPVMGAIAAGNTVVLKPCNVSSACSRLQADLVREYMDPLVVQVVGTTMKGDRHCTAALLEQRWDKIFFTGSPTVGKVVALGAAKHLTPCTLELGGKNPVFVDKSANIEMAAKRTCWARCMNAGQQCISPDFVLCHRDVVDEFCEAAKSWLDKFFEGDAQKSAHFGRIVGASQVERIKGMLKNHGGKVVCGGEVDEKERYVAPTVVRVGIDSPAMDDETFGPILWYVTTDR